MRLVNLVRPEEIVRTLRFKSLSRDVFANSVQRHTESQHALRPLAPVDLPWVLKALELEGLGIRDESDLEQRTIASQLRELVDEWLNTGRDADGSESPANRTLLRTVKAIQAVKKGADETPLRLTLDDFSDLVVAMGTQSARSKPVTNSFYCSASFERGLQEANRLFIALMASDWKKSICKCRHPSCGLYFFRERLRSHFRHGTFCCPEHQRHASAEACTKSLRARVRKELIEAAARKLLEWKIRDASWQDDARIKRDLAAELCFEIDRHPLLRARQAVKMNWVTRNRSDIEQRRVKLVRQTKPASKRAPRS